MLKKSFLRFVLLAGSIFLAALFFLVLTINALRTPITTFTTLPEGPYLVKDIQSGKKDSFPSPIVSVNDEVYFFAHDSQGQNLWASDGTEIGTYQIKDLNQLTGAVPTPYPKVYPTPRHSGEYPAVMKNQLFFTNDDGINGSELWRSDGSYSGTLMVKDISSDTLGSNPQNLTDIGNQLFFKATDSIHGIDLWVSDDTITNTKMVTDFVSATHMDIVGLKNKAYFSADDGTHGWELWTSDGTISGTYMIKDINPGDISSYPNLFFATDKFLFFQIHYPNAQQLWRTDGTLTGTIPLESNQNFSVYNSIVTTHKLAFINAKDVNNDIELWVSDGTTIGTHQVKNINPNGHSQIIEMFPFEDRIVFFANDGTHGSELWISNGTAEGTYMVKDINPGENGSLCSYITSIEKANLNGILFFTANNGEQGCELWRSDGTGIGTYMVHDINPGEASSKPTYLSVFSNTLFFAANDGIHGNELWSLGNIAPEAFDDTAVITMNQSITISVIDNDFDLNLDAVSMVNVTQPTHGTTAMIGQTVVYTPDTVFVGNDTFSYTIQDVGGLTAVAQVNITVTGYQVYLPIIIHQTGDR